MFSSDKNVDNIAKLIVELKHYVDLKTESVQISFVSNFSRLLSAIVISAILFMLFGLAILFISMMIASALSKLVGSLAIAYGIVVLFYLLLGILFFVKRHTWIEAPITNFLVHLFLEDKMNETANPQNKQAL